MDGKHSYEPLSLTLTHMNLWSLAARGPRQLLPFMLFSWALKGGLLSIAPQELLLALQPSTPSLDHGIVTWHTSGG